MFKAVILRFFPRFKGWLVVAPWRLALSTPKSLKEEARRRRTHLSGMPWTCSVAVRTFPTTKWPTCWPTPNLTWTIPFWVKFRTWKVSAASTWNRLDIMPTLTLGTTVPLIKFQQFKCHPIRPFYTDRKWSRRTMRRKWLYSLPQSFECQSAQLHVIIQFTGTQVHYFDGVCVIFLRNSSGAYLDCLSVVADAKSSGDAILMALKPATFVPIRLWVSDFFTW